MQSMDFKPRSSMSGSSDVTEAPPAPPPRGGSSKKKEGRSRKTSTLSIPKIPLITHKSFDENLLLPKVSTSKNPEPREITLKQNYAGDYGFTVRTSTLLEKVPLTG